MLTVVDHHRLATPPKAPYVDIRADVGATCTIYAEYMEAGLGALRGNRSDSATATAMFFGIQTDTDDFACSTPADFRAAASLKPHCDASPEPVARRRMTAETMDALKRALHDLQVIRDFAIAGVGRVLPTIATLSRRPQTTSCAAKTSTRFWFTALSRAERRVASHQQRERGSGRFHDQCIWSRRARTALWWW